jgi:hypothetical protein
MKGNLILFMLVFLLSSSAHPTVPKDAYGFDFNVGFIGMTSSTEDKILDAMALVKRVFTSVEFKNKVLNHRYLGRKAFQASNGLTNTQIYHKILAGAERLYPIKNYKMDLEVELYTDHKSNTVGFTRTLSKRIWMNTKFFNRFTAAKVAGNLVHEWVHKLGFSHDVKNTRRRKYSVPYAIGEITRQLATRL